MKRKVLLSLIVTFVTLIFLEIGLRQLVQPSQKCYGVLFNRELPPCKILSLDQGEENKEEKLNEWTNHIIVKGDKITLSDMWGFMREDELIGYAPKENFVSTNGWWQSNNFGARSSQPTSPKKHMNRERVLFFGDSYTQGHGLPGYETFVFVLNKRMQNIEFINFGVDGYSMGQAYLRFQTLIDKLEFDRVFLVFVPSVDLWRDVNVNRYIGDSWGGDSPCLPRFVVEDGELKLIHKPYGTIEELRNDNQDSIKPRYINHLRKYDYFYEKCRYESDYLLDNFIIFKSLKLYYCNHAWKRRKNLMDTDSEAMKVTKGIIEAMAQEVQSKGAEFSLIILPTDDVIKKYAENLNYKKSWDEMAAFVCSKNFTCYDLMKDFHQVPFESLDRAYEGSHYGPKTNALIADFILKNAF